jgi:hypothetical protein
VAAVTGDKLSLTAVVPNLNAAVTRVGGGTQNLASAIMPSGITTTGQTPSGTMPISAGNDRAAGMPLGGVTVDVTKPDGAVVNSNGLVELTKDGVTATFAPSVSNPVELSNSIAAQSPGATTVISNTGAFVTSFFVTVPISFSSLPVGYSGQLSMLLAIAPTQSSFFARSPSPTRLAAVASTGTMVTQPSLAILKGTATGTSSYSLNKKNILIYQDSNGNVQAMYPKFSDIAALRAALVSALGAGPTVQPDLAGSAIVKYGTSTYTLSPDYVLVPVPAAQAGKTWWADAANNKFFIVNSDGTAQGFTVK